MRVLLHSVLTVSCYNQHFLISILPPLNPKSAGPSTIFLISIFLSPNSESANQHFTPAVSFFSHHLSKAWECRACECRAYKIRRHEYTQSYNY